MPWAEPLWSPSLVFWFGCQYNFRSFLHWCVWLPSSSLYFFFFFFKLTPLLNVCLRLTRGFSDWAGEEEEEEEDVAGFLSGLPAGKHQNIGVSHLSSTSGPAACEWGPGDLVAVTFNLLFWFLQGTTQSAHQRSLAWQFSTNHFCRS